MFVIPLQHASGALQVPVPPDMSNLAGWTDLVDTRQRMEGLRCRQSSYIRPSLRSATAPESSRSAYHPSDRDALSVSSARGKGGGLGPSSSSPAATSHPDKGVTIKDEHNLYFLVNIEGRKSGLPAEKDLREISIFPALTLVNATPVELDVSLVPSALDLRVKGLGSSAATLSGISRLQQMQGCPILRATLLRQSTFYVYEVPPNRQIKMKLKFAMLENAGWSQTINDLLSPTVGNRTETLTGALPSSGIFRLEGTQGRLYMGFCLEAGSSVFRWEFAPSACLFIPLPCLMDRSIRSILSTRRD